MTPEENPERHIGSKRTAEKQLLILSINVLAFIGLVLFGYGIAAQVWSEKWVPLEKGVHFLSDISTLIGAALTFFSVYQKPNMREPEAISKKYTAPLCILLVAITTAVYFKKPEMVHPHMITGIAILAIAGGLFRTMSR